MEVIPFDDSFLSALQSYSVVSQAVPLVNNRNAFVFISQNKRTKKKLRAHLTWVEVKIVQFSW